MGAKKPRKEIETKKLRQKKEIETKKKNHKHEDGRGQEGGRKGAASRRRDLELATGFPTLADGAPQRPWSADFFFPFAAGGRERKGTGEERSGSGEGTPFPER